MLVANNWNVVQYSVLMKMMAQVSGLEAGTLLHVIADAHIYERHIPIVEDMLSRQPFDPPVFMLDSNVSDFYQFDKNSFVLKNYQSHESPGPIPVAV
jgi:thymidylate synthase